MKPENIVIVTAVVVMILISVILATIAIQMKEHDEAKHSVGPDAVQRYTAAALP